jgi:hypothetical protein
MNNVRRASLYPVFDPVREPPTSRVENTRDRRRATGAYHDTISIVDLWVFDLASLRFRVDTDARTLSVTSAAGEMLASVAIPEGTSEREAVFLALDAALEAGRLIRDGGTLEIGFANPFTNQVAVGAVPETVAYSDGEPLTIGATGIGADLRDGVLMVAGRELIPVETAMATVAAAISAHQ